jgi:putative spermidine/putrescine transport system permease protein
MEQVDHQLSSPQRTFPAERRIDRSGGALLVAPACAVLLVFFVYPLATIVWDSLSQPRPGFGTYVSMWTDGVTARILLRTVVTALLVAVCTLVIAYPYAYAMDNASRRTRLVMSGIALVPLWTGLMARNFAWYVLEQRGGVIERAAAAFGIHGLELLGSAAGAGVAMVQVMLPYMVVALYNSFSSIDRRLLDAAGSLGARPWRVTCSVYLRMSMPGVVSGFSLVFILALGFYITPAVLGSPQQAMVSQLLALQVTGQLDFGGAGALTSLLLAAALLVLVLVSRLGPAGPAGALALRGDRDRRDGDGPGRTPWGLRVWNLLVALLLLAPTLVVLPMSFSASSVFEFPSSHWSLHWYAEFFTAPQWLASVRNSLEAALLAAVLATVLGVPAALGLDRLSRRTRGALRLLMLTPVITPGIAYAVAVYGVFLRWGLSGSLTGVVCVHTAIALPFVIVAVGISLANYGPALDQAAQSLGAGTLAVLWSVTLPLIRLGAACGFVLAFVASFDESVIALFLQGPDFHTLPVQMYDSITQQVDPTIAAASSLVVVATSAAIGLLAVVLTRLSSWRRSSAAAASGVLS